MNAAAAPVLRASELQRPFTGEVRSCEATRGALTELLGPDSSGRTALLCSWLAAMTGRGEFCAYVDAAGTFDLRSAAEAGVRLSQVLWVRSNGQVEHALKAADMLANAGGFGLIAIDLGDVAEAQVARIPLAAWFRLRHTIENTQTAMVSVAQRRHAHPCSMCKVELRRERATWDGYLRGFTAVGEALRSQHRQAVRFEWQSGRG